MYPHWRFGGSASVQFVQLIAGLVFDDDNGIANTREAIDRAMKPVWRRLAEEMYSFCILSRFVMCSAEAID